MNKRGIKGQKLKQKKINFECKLKYFVQVT